MSLPEVRMATSASTSVHLNSLKQLSKDELLQLRRQYISPSFSIHYSNFRPLKIVRGDGVYLFDEENKPYIDCINNVTHVGHCNPRVVSAFTKHLAQSQFDLDPYTGDVVADHQLREKYVERLLATFPGSGLDTVLFVSSGTEANDLAISLCEAATGHTQVIALDGAYHGHSKPLNGLSTYKLNQLKIPGAVKQSTNAIIAPLPDIFRGKYHNPATAGQQFADEVKHLIDIAHQENKTIACFIVEAMPGCAGQVQLPAGYLEAAFKYIRDAGGLCIIDEVQTGFGRAGSSFWIYQDHGVQPDVVTIGKPMGNGHPISAVITKKSIVDKFAEQHGGPACLAQYMGNTVGIAVANAVLSVIIDQNLQENSFKLGKYIVDGLNAMKKKHSSMGDIRGYGLFLGLEIVKRGDNPVADPDTAKELVKRVLIQHRILIKDDGVDGNVIKIKPPVVFTKEHADKLLYAIDTVLTDLDV